MSEQSQGSGWWMASDGKWYPPESRPAPLLPPPDQRTTVTVPIKDRDEWWALAGAGLLIVGSFMKWATAGPFAVSGTDGDGWITIVAGAAAAAFIWKQKFWQATVAALVALALVIWKLADLSSISDDSFMKVSPGVGLYLCGAGAAACALKSALRWWVTR